MLQSGNVCKKQPQTTRLALLHFGIHCVFNMWFPVLDRVLLELTISLALCEKCPYSELFWSAFSRIWTEYGEILRISPYSVRMRKNTDHNNSEYGHFSCSDGFSGL